MTGSSPVTKGPSATPDHSESPCSCLAPNPGVEQKARPCAVDSRREVGRGALQLTPKDVSQRERAPVDELRVPSVLVAGREEFERLFADRAIQAGLDPARAAELLGLVPGAIRGAPCFLDKLDGPWLYDFGESTRGVPALGVGVTFHSVDRLIGILACAQSRLTKLELRAYLHRLANPKKHRVTLFEFSPVLRLPPETSTDYEVVGEGPGKTTVDWRVCAPGGVPVLLEVKQRLGDLVRSFEKVRNRELDAGGRVLPPDHDTDMLFVSVETKFLPRSPDVALQGAWVGTHLNQDRGRLEASFSKLDHKRVHFAVLGGWEPAAHVMVCDESLRGWLVDVLKLEEANGLLFEAGAPG